ncbi:MAG: LuxR C-terminal-related transcriptional regulator [Pseudomonadota bacterium]
MTYPDQIAFVVNGDSRIRSALRELLSAHGIQAITFESAADYLAYPKASAPACLLLDVELPDCSGLDLQLELAGDCLPVVFVTRQADVAFSVRAIKEGAVDFLTIPFKPEQLLVAVRAAITRDSSTRAERSRISELRRRLARLTARERQVMALVVSGMLNKQVASDLGISEITVQVHRRRVMQKMEAASFAELVRDAETLRIPRNPERPIGRSRYFGAALGTPRMAV